MIKKLIPIIVFAVFGFYLMGGLFSAKLGMIDDHEIPYFLGSDGRITLSELPGVIGKTEIGAWGEYLRFRPSYYTLRALETMLWRDNATLWFATRYVLLVLSMWMGFSVMSKYFPKILSYLFIFYTLTMPFWPDLLTRLGPSEIYGVPALLGFAYGYVFKRHWILLLSYLVAVGAKENFLFLLPLLLIWIWQMYRSKAMTKSLWMGSFVALGFTTWVVSAILVATGRAGADVYGKDISYMKRILIVVKSLPHVIIDRDIVPGILGLGYLLWVWIRTKSNEIKNNLILGFTVLAITFSQYVFYDNKLPSLSRYDFPALILFPIFNLCVIYAILPRIKHKNWRMLIKTGVYGVLALIMCAYVLFRGYILINIQRDKVIAKTNDFSHKIETISNTAINKPTAKLIFVSQRFIDFEPVTSVVRYLVSKSVNNTFEFKYIPEPKLTDTLGIHLEGRMIGAMDGTNKEELFTRFSPYTDPSQDCFSITFGEALPLVACPEIARF